MWCWDDKKKLIKISWNENTCSQIQKIQKETFKYVVVFVSIMQLSTERIKLYVSPTKPNTIISTLYRKSYETFKCILGSTSCEKILNSLMFSETNLCEFDFHSSLRDGYNKNGLYFDSFYNWDFFCRTLIFHKIREE